MKIYTGNPSGSKDKIAKLKKYSLGVMLSVGPSSQCIKALVKANISTAIDNGAFMAWQKGYPFNEKFFFELLEKAYKDGASADFIVCPDIVTGGLRSFHYSMDWAKGKLLTAPKLALAVQDGIKPSDIHGADLKYFTHIFVGGSVEWKWKTAKEWVDFAHDNGKLCHIGRCGTIDKIKYAKEIGADSIDSTSFVRNDSWHILEELNGCRQGNLFN